MLNLVITKSSSYRRYEELLIKKEALSKEAENYRVLYEKCFDTLNKEVYAAKMECVRKRKVVSYCKSYQSTGKDIFKKDMDLFIDKAMKEYQDTLDYLYDNGEKEEDTSKPHGKDSKQVKAIYHRLAKLIHPDMNEEIKDDATIQDLWNRTCVAYNCNNADELAELEVLINKYLASINHDHYEVQIEDINEKIFNLNREIYRITHSYPYRYKYLIDDKVEVEKKQNELKEELNDYQRYCDELDEEIAHFKHLIIEK